MNAQQHLDNFRRIDRYIRSSRIAAFLAFIGMFAFLGAGIVAAVEGDVPRAIINSIGLIVGAIVWYGCYQILPSSLRRERRLAIAQAVNDGYHVHEANRHICIMSNGDEPTARVNW